MLPPNLPSDVRQSKLVKAFKKCGFEIDYVGGRGSHVKVIDPKTNKFIIIQYKLYKIVLKEILKEAELLGYNAEEIINNY